MTKQEIVNKLATKGNFHKYVEVCLHEGLSIEKLKFAPEIYVYYDDTDYLHKETGEYRDVSCDKVKINLKVKNLQFEVDGELMTGVNNFFKHYSKITKFIITEEYSYTCTEITLIVKPSLLNGIHWSKDDVNDHYEISFECHSLHDVSMSQKVNDVVINEKYYVDGVRFTEEIWKKESREQKLSRILGVDLKAERLKKEKEENKWNYSYITIDDDDFGYTVA